MGQAACEVLWNVPPLAARPAHMAARLNVGGVATTLAVVITGRTPHRFISMLSPGPPRRVWAAEQHMKQTNLVNPNN